jgi:hypothetical protein
MRREGRQRRKAKEAAESCPGRLVAEASLILPKRNRHWNPVIEFDSLISRVGSSYNDQLVRPRKFQVMKLRGSCPMGFPFCRNKVTRTKAGSFVIVVLADIYAVIVLGKFALNPEFDPLENVLLFSLENGCHKIRLEQII